MPMSASLSFSHTTRSIFGVVEFFPATANGWQRKEWKGKSRSAVLPFLQKVAEEDVKGDDKN
jgi:hypothetical protein